jgi:serine/threonine protein kinase
LDKQPGNASQSSNEKEFSDGSIVFEKFEILSFVASGGFGRVYKARDIHRNLEVALKVLLVEASDDRALMRFQSEARTASRLKHPNIATINDFGFSHGMPYLSMEFVEGESLEKIIGDTETLRLPEFIEIFSQITMGLIHAHNNGVVHRDLKPANIIVRKTADGELIAKVLDFGVATLIDRAQDDEGRLTPTGNIVGSPLYMSPEQGQGKAVSEKSDVYSLGCMMYRCLTGQAPFHGETAIETIIAHIEKQPPKLIEITEEELPEELCDLIDRMLLKQPEQRPQLEGDINRLLENLHYELSNLEDAEKEPAIPSTTGDTNAKENPRKVSRVKLTILFTLAILTIFGFIAFYLGFATEKGNYSPNPQLKLLNVKTDSPLPSFSQLEKVVSSQSESPDALLMAYNGQASYHLDKTTLNDTDLRKLGLAPQLKELTMSKTQITTLAHIGNFKNLEALNIDNAPVNDGALKNLKSLAKLRSLITSHTAISDASLPDLSRLTSLRKLSIRHTRISAIGIVNGLKPLVNLQTLQIGGNHEITVAQCRQIVHNFPKLVEFQIDKCDKIDMGSLKTLRTEFPDIAFAPLQADIRELAEKAMETKDLKAAQVPLEKINKMLRRAYGINSARLLPWYLTSATNALRSGDEKTAKRELEELTVLADVHNDYTTLLSSLNYLSDIASAHNDFKKSEDIQKRAYRLARAVGSKDLDEHVFNIGNYYFRRAALSTALTYYREALAIRKSNHSWRHPQTALLLTLCAECELNLGQLAQARKDVDAAIPLFLGYPPKTDAQKSGYCISYRTLADLEFKEKKIEEAMQNNERALALCKKFQVLPLYFTSVLTQRHTLFFELKKSPAEIKAVKDQLDSSLNQSKQNAQKIR